MSTEQEQPASELASDLRRPLARARRVEEQPRRAKRFQTDDSPEVPTPGVTICFRIFCAFVTFGAAIGAGCSFITLSNNFSYRESQATFEFVAFLVLALVVFTLFVIPLLSPTPKPWKFWYAFGLILLCLLTVYLSLFSIILLCFWFSAANRHFYDRTLRRFASRRDYRDDYDFDD